MFISFGGGRNSGALRKLEFNGTHYNEY